MWVCEDTLLPMCFEIPKYLMLKNAFALKPLMEARSAEEILDETPPYHFILGLVSFLPEGKLSASLQRCYQNARVSLLS